MPVGRFNLQLGLYPLIMGIINLTVDSFSQDGLLKGRVRRSLLAEKALRLARKMLREGANLIDIGAESTRPGARPISVKEELSRIIPAVTKISDHLDIPISVDTYKPEVAQAAIEAGASIINNIMGTNPKFNVKIAKICAKGGAGLVLMHIKGKPATMQRRIRYKSLIVDIIASLKRAINCAREAGLNSKSIIIDPGIGFGKTAGDNLEIINRLSEFASLRRPILIGVSRKSFIGKVLNRDEKQRLFGTAASVSLAVANGAHILRVHDVSQMYDVARMSGAIVSYQNSTILN